MNKMHSGMLNCRGTIQYKAVSRDAYGGETVVWSDEAAVWMSIEGLSGREYFAAQQLGGEITHKIRMRFRRGMQPGKRILHNGRVLDVLSVINVGERNRELEIMAKEEV